MPMWVKTAYLKMCEGIPMMANKQFIATVSVDCGLTGIVRDAPYYPVLPVQGSAVQSWRSRRRRSD